MPDAGGTEPKSRARKGKRTTAARPPKSIPTKPSTPSPDRRSVAEIREQRDQALALLLRYGDGKSRGSMFRVGAKAAALGLKYRWVIIAAIDEAGSKGKTLAFWDNGRFRRKFQFSLAATPFEAARSNRGYALVRDGIQKWFRKDPNLAGLKAESCQLAVYYDEARRPAGFSLAANDTAENESMGPQRDLLRLINKWVGLEADRLATERRLTTSEENYRALFNNAQVGLGRTALSDGMLIEANERLAKMFGYRNIEEAIAEFVASKHYVDPAARDTAIKQLKKTGEVRDFQTAFTRKDGAVIWVRCSMRLSPSRDAIDIVGTDVTDEVRAREDLKASEGALAAQTELLSATFNNMTEGLIVFDGEKRILAANSRAADLVDIPAKMLTPGASFLDIVRFSAERGDYGDGDRGEIIKNVTAKTDQRTVVELERVLPSGKCLRIQAAPRPGGGQIVTYTDITKLKRHEAEIAKQSEMLAATLDNMAQGLIAFDSELTILASNVRAADLLDVPADKVRPGASFEAMIRFAAKRGDYGDGDADALVKKFRQMAWDSEPQHFVRQRPDGAWLETRGYPRPGGGYVATYTDVTERKRNEERLQRLNARLKANTDDLERSNAELEQFAYVASHDLQEPLRMVSSYCQLLQNRYAEQLDQDANEFIDYAVDGANRMRSLIQDLLAYSRVGSRSKPFGSTDLTAVAQTALQNLGMAIEESAAKVELEALPTVSGDEIQLVQLFQNLIGNAIKFRGDAAPLVRVGVREDSGAWVISIRDNGVGIDPDYKDRIFVIFQRLQGAHAYEGTGIGLAVCKKIVERHGGTIWVESLPGEGSTFFFTIPAKGVSDD